MKRFAFLLILFCGGAKFAHANNDWAGNQYVNSAVWRASNTCSSDSMVPIATAAVNFGGFVTASTGTEISKIGFFDGSNNLQIATVTIVPAMIGFMTDYGVQFSSGGLRYSNVGGSCVTILWQYKRQPDPGR